MITGTLHSRVAASVSEEEINYLRAAHLIINVCPRAVRIVFDQRNPPSHLTKQLAAQAESLKRCKGIYRTNWPTLFSPSGGVAKSINFDITLMMTLLRNFTCIPFTPVPEPGNGWDEMPDQSDLSEGADLVRIKLYRNEIFHANEAKLSRADFNQFWNDIKQSVDRLSGGALTKEVEDLKDVILDQGQREIIQFVINHDKEIRDMKSEISELKLNLFMSKNERDQIMILLKQWESEDCVFYETSGYAHALELLETNSFLTIIGRPGTGKTAMARHIALKMMHDGWDVIPVEEAEEISKFGTITDKQIFVMDDILGVFDVKMDKHDDFIKRKQRIMNVLQNQSKLIMTCRKSVYNRAIVLNSWVTASTLDLDSRDFDFTEEEKLTILSNHCEQAKIPRKIYDGIEVKNANFMFPFLCKVYCTETRYQDIGTAFFEKANECFLENLNELMINHGLQYASIVLLCFTEDNTLSQKILHQGEERLQNIKKDVFNVCGVNLATSNKDVLDALSHLQGTFTENSWKGFTFMHDSFLELVTYHFGKVNQEHVLKYSPSSYVHNKLTLDETSLDDSLYLNLEKVHYRALADRIMRDIKGLELYEVFRSSVLKDKRFFISFAEILQKQTFVELQNCFLTATQQEQSGKRSIDDIDDRQKISEEEDNNDTSLWWIRELFEKGNIRVMRWVIFFGHLHLLQYLFERAKKHVDNLYRFVSPEKRRKKITKLVLGQKNEQLRAFILACSGGSLDVVNLLINHTETNYVNKQVEIYPHYSPLTAASRCGHLTICECLINNGAVVDGHDGHHVTPSYEASLGGHYHVLKYLLEKGANPNTCGVCGESLLYVASEKGFLNIVQLLITHKADPNICGVWKQSSLFAASENGHADVALLLLQNRAEPNICNISNKSSLYIACERGHYEVIQNLFKHGADPNICSNNKKSPLYVSIEKGYYKISQYLLQNGADAKIVGPNNTTTLYLASYKGCPDTVSLLLRRSSGVDNYEQPEGTAPTPLRIALYRGNINVVRVIVKHKNNLKTNAGNHILYNELCQLKHLQSKLMPGRKSLSLENKRNVLPNDLWTFITENGGTFLDNLCMMGFDVNNCDEKRKTFLCRVVRKTVLCNEEIVKILLSSGADVNVRDKKHVSVLEHARLRMNECRKKKDNKDFYNKKHQDYKNVFRILKGHVRRYSV